jgi:hypothetical protein
VLPELVDAAGEVVAFAFGANMARARRPSDLVALAPGDSFAIVVSGTFRLVADDLTWRGGDGVSGAWRVKAGAQPYRMRLRYRGPRPDEPPSGVSNAATAPLELSAAR